MTELFQQPDFGTLIKSVFAYHCFGDKATGILSSIDQPYKDIIRWSIDDIGSKDCMALFVFTDNAEVYASKIDAFIKQYKDVTRNIFILDLHSNQQHKQLKEKWEFYNILIDKYDSLQNNILHYLLFFHHFIETHGLISMDFHDIKSVVQTATFIAAGTSTTLTEAIYPIPHSSNIRVLALGVELKDNELKAANKEMEVLAAFFEQLPEDTDIKWQISPKCGNPYTEYIVGFNEAPSQLADNQ